MTFENLLNDKEPDDLLGDFENIEDGNLIYTDERIKPILIPDAVSESLSQYYRQIYSGPTLTAEEEKVLGLKVQNGTPEEKKEAVNELVTRNLKYVVKIANRYIGNGVQIEDLVQEGNLGLITAAQRFDPSLGFRFTTYATYWIRQKIIRSLAEKGGTIRAPVYITEELRQINLAEKKLIKENINPTYDAIAKETGLSVSRVKKRKSQAFSVVSLDTPVGDDNSEPDTFLIDLIADETETFPCPEESVIKDSLSHSVSLALSSLTEKERAVITCRFGLNGEPPQTLEVVGKKLHVTRERIRQIENNALLKLKNSKQLRGAKIFLQ